MKITLGRSGWLALVAALATLATAGSGYAATYTWTSASNANWYSLTSPLTLSASQWSPNSPVMGGSDDVLLQSFRTPTVNAATAIRDLTFGSSTATTVTGPSNLSLRNIIANTSLSSGANTISGAGGLTMSGNIDNSAALTITRTTTISGNSEKTGSGSLSLGPVNGGGNLFTFSNGTTTLNGAFQPSIAVGTGATVIQSANQTSGTVGNNGGTFRSTANLGAYTQTGPTSSGTFTSSQIGSLVATDGTLTLSGITVSGSTYLNNVTTTSGPTNNTFNGPVTIDGGTNTLNANFKGNVTVNGGANELNAAVDPGVNILVTGGSTSLGGNNSGGSITQSGGILTGVKNVDQGVNSGTGTIAFLNNAVVGGNSTIGSTMSIDPASANGSVQFDTVTLTPTANVNLTFESTGNNQSLSGNSFDYAGGNLDLDLTDGGQATSGQSWDFLNFTTISGTAGSVQINTLVGGQYASLNGVPFTYAPNSSNRFDSAYGPDYWLSGWVQGTDPQGYDHQRFIYNQATGVLTVVPEPSTIVFAGIGAAMLGWQTWAGRRRKARMKLIEEHTRKLSEERGLA